jgi:hypothetical protein
LRQGQLLATDAPSATVNALVFEDGGYGEATSLGRQGRAAPRGRAFARSSSAVQHPNFWSITLQRLNLGSMRLSVQSLIVETRQL